MSKPPHERALISPSVEEIARHARSRPPACAQTRVVLVDGPAGSGKTTLAGMLAASLGSTVQAESTGHGLQEPGGGVPQVLHADDMYEGWNGLATLDEVLISQVLEPVRRGRPAQFRVWDWHQDRRGEILTVTAGDMLVIEGVGVAMRRAREYASLVLWVEAPATLRLARGIARDGEHVRAEWVRWQRNEQEHFAAQGTRESADLVIDGSRAFTSEYHLPGSP